MLSSALSSREELLTLARLMEIKGWEIEEETETRLYCHDPAGYFWLCLSAHTSLVQNTSAVQNAHTVRNQ